MLDELIKNDINFNEAKFKSYIDNIFVKLYTAIMLDELDTVKHFISEELYIKYTEVIKNLKDKNRTQIYDELNVKSSEIIGVEIKENEYIIHVKLISRSLDYIIDTETGNFISGNNQTRTEKENYLDFKKIRNFDTQSNIRRCPSCGASINVNENGKCPYCDTTYNLDDYEYILYNINN